MRQLITLFLTLASLLLVSCKSQDATLPTVFIDTGVNPDSWASIPAGEYGRGQHEHETDVPYDFEMMVTDVTNDQFARFLNESIIAGATDVESVIPLTYYPGDVYRGFEHEEEIPDGWYMVIAIDDLGVRIQQQGPDYVPIAGYENHPAVLVTWFGARAYCDYYGWRLPTEVEWEKAARGTDKRPYPWGNELGSQNANYYSSYDIFEKTFGKQGSTTPVGFYNGGTYQGFDTVDSASPYGLYDMAGNVWQWTGDVYEDQHYRYMRGGSKDTYGYNLRVWTRNSAHPEYYSPAVGFRCVRD